METITFDQAVQADILKNWGALNSFVMRAREDELELLMKIEKQGKARVQFLLRIHGRYNVVRNARERQEILGAK